MIWMIELAIIAVTAMLIRHARVHYTRDFVLVLWSGGAMMGLLREYALSGVMHLYSYGDFHLTYVGLPLIYLVFWTDLGYIGLVWSNNFLDREYLKVKPFDHHLPLVFLTLVFFAFFFEAMLSQVDLIRWQVDSYSKLWGGTPVLAPFAYGWTAVLFVKSLKILTLQKQQNLWQLALKFTLVQVPVVLMLGGLLLLSNLLIILVFS